MRRQDLDHLVAAAAQIVGEREFVVVGSQSILGSHPDAPETLLRSQEADIYPKRRPDLAIEIEGALGDGSAFQQTYGYYAHAVGPETVKAPRGWDARLVAIEIPPRPRSEASAVAYCLEAHDLVLSKLAANRERDWEFAKEALAAGLVESGVLLESVGDLPVDPSLRATIAEMLTALTETLARPLRRARAVRDVRASGGRTRALLLSRGGTRAQCFLVSASPDRLSLPPPPWKKSRGLEAFKIVAMLRSIRRSKAMPGTAGLAPLGPPGADSRFGIQR